MKKDLGIKMTKIKIEIGQVWRPKRSSFSSNEIKITHFGHVNDRLVAFSNYLDKGGFVEVDENHYAHVSSYELVQEATPETVREPTGYVEENKGTTMKFINETMAKRWAEVKDQVKDRPKETLIMNFSEAWAGAMEKLIDNGSKLSDVVLLCFKKTVEQFGGSENITKEIVQVSISILVPCWYHGAELKKWLEDQTHNNIFTINGIHMLQNQSAFTSLVGNLTDPLTSTSNEDPVNYHIHVYGPKQGIFSKGPLVKLHTALTKDFTGQPGFTLNTISDKPVGPHPKPQFCIEVDGSSFHNVVRYLMLNRNNLSVLVHPKTGHPVKDHTKNCFWMGTPLKLDLGKL